MTLTEIYGLGHQARRPRTYLALGGALVTLYLCVALKTDVLVYALGALYLAFVLRRLIVNPGKGFRLWPDRIDVFTRHGPLSMRLDDVGSVSIGQSPEGETICALNLHDGGSVPLNGVEKMEPGKLIREFGRRGVRILG